jgi:hypothetical protein
MAQSISRSGVEATSPGREIEAKVDETLNWLRPRLVELCQRFVCAPRTPTSFVALELGLVMLLREFGRALLEGLLNGLEGDGRLLPHDVVSQGQGYRRLGKKTRNAHVASLFGILELWRFAYRFWDPSVKEPAIFPLELELGLGPGSHARVGWTDRPANGGGRGDTRASPGVAQARARCCLGCRAIEKDRGGSP